MTPVETIKAINRAMYKLPAQEQDRLKRGCPKTWQIVCLYNDGDISPTKAGGKRLTNLLSAIRNAGKMLNLTYFGGSGQTETAQPEDDGLIRV